MPGLVVLMIVVVLASLRVVGLGSETWLVVVLAVRVVGLSIYIRLLGLFVIVVEFAVASILVVSHSIFRILIPVFFTSFGELKIIF
jgi:hypothetical protein